MQYAVPDSDTLSDLMAGARKRLGLSQRQFAAQLGMRQQNYARIEKNPGAVAFDTVLLILRALYLDMHMEDVPLSYALPQQTSGPDQMAEAPMQYVFRGVQPSKRKKRDPRAKTLESAALPPASIWGNATPEEF